MTPRSAPESRGEPVRRLQYRFQPGAVQVRLLRATVRSLLADHGFDEDAVNSTVLGLDEALTNACTHGACTEPVELAIDLFADRIAFEIRDRGNGAVQNDDEGVLPEDHSESGRGMFLIHHTMDEVSFHEREGGGTLVRLVKRR